ncbi:MAG: 16S rRNA (adenine(1518)-N(6)/adenine(1519)-N(6))-dimethyltransferase RsmA [Desulfobacterales bacterium]|jgi:16S rRNA (adenine1518-N6/adenine1519-N6)-dimethyltransferase|nr:16S rRNA (adenine(1518)-N(6)/adenine(1519)-N(6))-dimethyltransferase RsmA [Desulfobacterales bacterium]
MAASPRSLLAGHRLRPRRQLGQNFLAQPAVAELIVARAGVSADEIILEIGPGLGALTIPLARAARSVIAVERDPHLVPLLSAELAAGGVGNVRIIAMDALELDLAALARRVGGSLTVFGNLPYNISSQIVIRLMDARRHIRRAVLMFQRELAQRLTAAPGGRNYGRITALLTYCASVRRLAEVKASRFYPPPKVDAEVLEIVFSGVQPDFPAHDEARLARLITAAFGQRRKTLKNALAGSALGLSSAALQQALLQAGIDPSRRAETITPAEFVRLEISLRGCRIEERGGAEDSAP